MSGSHPAPLFVVELRDRWQALVGTAGPLEQATVYVMRPLQDLELPVAIGVAVSTTDVEPVRTSTGERLGRDVDLLDVACVIEVASGDGPDPLPRMTRVYEVLGLLLTDVALANRSGWAAPGVIRASVTRTAWTDGRADNDQGVSSLQLVVTADVTRRRR